MLVGFDPGDGIFFPRPRRPHPRPRLSGKYWGIPARSRRGPRLHETLYKTAAKAI